MSDGKKLTLYYDGTCRLCSAVAGKFAAREHLIAMDVMRVGPPSDATLEDVIKEVHVVDERGATFKGFDAVVRIMAETPKLRFLARMGSLPIFRQLGHVLYRLIAAHRYFFFGRKSLR